MRLIAASDYDNPWQRMTNEQRDLDRVMRENAGIRGTWN